MLAPIVGQELRGCKWVGVPFAGGMAEVACIKASTIVVSDLHRHVINLALCVKADDLRPRLAERLSSQPFHPDCLSVAQASCRAIESSGNWPDMPCLDWACDYFTACWMGRSHKSGIDDEFNGGLSIRWNANGGDSNKRYRSAAASLDAWGVVMQRCNFSVLDAFEFLERCEDSEGHGLYIDAPWPDDGDRYKHRFTESDHRRLAKALLRFNATRVVVRFGDHPLIRELYPEPRWTWRHLKGRDQANNGEKAEVLIVNGPLFGVT